MGVHASSFVVVRSTLLLLHFICILCAFAFGCSVLAGWLHGPFTKTSLGRCVWSLGRVAKPVAKSVGKCAGK